MNTPLVTVFSLIYNTNPEYTIQVLECIRRNNYPNLQHIIIDDCSPDQRPSQVVEAWVKENNYPCEFYRHERNMGVTKTLNEILQKAKGKYLIGCSDDLLSDDRIRGDVELMEKLPEDYAITFCISQDMNAEGDLLPFFSPGVAVPRDDNYFGLLLENNFISAPGVTMRTDSIRKAGGFDENLVVEDYDMWLRLSHAGYKFKLQPKVGAYYRVHAGGVSTKLRVLLEAYVIRCKYDYLPKVKVLLIQEIERTFAHKEYDLMKELIRLYYEKYGKQRMFALYSSGWPRGIKMFFRSLRNKLISLILLFKKPQQTAALIYIIHLMLR